MTTAAPAPGDHMSEHAPSGPEPQNHHDGHATRETQEAATTTTCARGGGRLGAGNTSDTGVAGTNITL